VPFELVAEGGDQVVVVDQITDGLVTGAIGDAPLSRRFWQNAPAREAEPL